VDNKIITNDVSSNDVTSNDVAQYQIISSEYQKPEKSAGSQRKDRRNNERNSIFSIGFKLVSIVTLIVIVSLGSITALVSWLVRQDLQIAAEDSNFETNRRSSMEAEETLNKMRSDTHIFINTINSLAGNNYLTQSSSEYFFKQNPRITAISFSRHNENNLFF